MQYALRKRIMVTGGAGFLGSHLVARLNLPNMAYAPQEKVDVYAEAVRGLLQLEPHPEKRLKYLDFIDIYADLDDNQRQDYATRYPREAKEMTGFAERFIEQGKQEGIQQGVQQGVQQGIQQGIERGVQQGIQQGIERGVQQGIQEVIQHQRHMLARQIRKRFGDDAAEASDPLLARIDDPKQLDDLAEALLDSPDTAAWLRTLRTSAG